MAQGVSGYWPSSSGYSDGYNKIRIYYNQTYTPGASSSSVYVELQMCDSTIDRTGYLRGTVTAAGITLNSGDTYVSFGSDGNWTKVCSSGTGSVSNGSKINFSFSDVKYIRDGVVKTTYGSKSGSVDTTYIPQNSTLTISKCTGSTLTVKDSNGNSISNGGTLSPNGKYYVYFGNATGYNSTTCTVSGISGNISSGTSFTPNGSNITVKTSGSKLNTYTLSISAGANSSILVNRTSTNQSGASTGIISSSDTLYYGDKLSIQFGANEGYEISTRKINDSSVTGDTTHTVTANVSVSSVAVVRSFTLTVNIGTGTNITVTRTSSPKQNAGTGNLSNGAKIYYSDVLTVTYGAQTGYESVSCSLNGSSVSSGSTHTVIGGVTVSSSASVKRFTLSISKGTGSSIQVSRTSSPKQGALTGVLSSGDTIYYSDVLDIYFDKDTGYSLDTHKVNGNTFTSGNQHTVTGAVSVSATAVLVEYTLNVGVDDGITVTVNRTSSPLGNASTGVIESGTPLYHNDKISVTFTAKNGYKVATHTVNGNTFTSGALHTVSGAVTVVGSSTVKEFTLTVSAGTGSKIVVKRNNSALGGGSIGQILSGAKIYFGDVLQVTFTPNDGYGITSSTVNGSEFVSGGSFTVEGNVTVESTASAADFRLTLDIATGSSIVVERTESPNGGGSIGKIASGERLYYNDVLKITFGVSASEGYNLTSHTVNDENFESGYMYTVKTSITVKTTTEVISYSLSIASDQGSTVSVTRTKSPKGNAELKDLTSGEVIYFSDELTILFSSKDGYVITTSTLNDENFPSGGSVEVKSDIAVVCASEIKSYTLSIAPENGFTITVTRTASPNKGASLTELTSGATIYYEDALSYQFTAKTGYIISSRTLNGASVSASGNHVVRENVSFSATASVRSFKLSITKDAGCTVAVTRTSSPLKGADLVSLLDGATIYYNDVLRIVLTSLTGFEFTTNTVNNTPFLSGDKTVTANVTIVALTKQMGLVYIKDEEGNSRYQVYINEGTEISPDFQLYVPYVKTKEVAGWELCS